MPCSLRDLMHAPNAQLHRTLQAALLCPARYNSAASTLVAVQLFPPALHWDVEAACTHVQTGWLPGQSPVV